MGLIEKIKNFSKKRKQKAFNKNCQIIKNPKAIKEDRVGAIESLASFEDKAAATKALLARFNFSLEHGIQDSREKEKIMDSILSFKENAISPTLDYLKQGKSIAWPVKILSSLISKKELTDALESSLIFGDIDFSQENVNKNYDILCHPRNHALADKGKKLFAFLKVHDERLRVAAVEAILTQGDESNYEELEELLLDNSSENIRLKQAVAQKFIDLGRRLKKTHLFKTGFLHPDLIINKDYSLRYADEAQSIED